MSIGDENILGVIPARGGSKGIPRKNIKTLNGLPLITYTIMASLESEIDYTAVSTDSEDIAEVSRSYGAEIIERPSELATDEAPTEPAISHAIETLEDKHREFSHVVLLQPTSPLRDSKDIDNALHKFEDNDYDSLLSVFENEYFFWKEDEPLNYDYEDRPRRQDKDWEYIENGAIYITKVERFLENENRLCGDIGTYVMPKWKSIEIDEPLDLAVAEKILKEEKNKKKKTKMSGISSVIFDVDGIFTDGSVYLNERGKEMLKFSRIDGKGIELLRNEGFKLFTVTSEDSKIIEERMDKLKLDEVYTGIKNKLDIYRKLKREHNLDNQEICFCGDDVQDLPIIRKAGYSCCPLNSQKEVKEACDFASDKRGGEGFVREISNMLISKT